MTNVLGMRGDPEDSTKVRFAGVFARNEIKLAIFETFGVGYWAAVINVGTFSLKRQSGGTHWIGVWWRTTAADVTVKLFEPLGKHPDWKRAE